MPFFRFYAKPDYFSNVVVVGFRRFGFPDPEVFSKVAAEDISLFHILGPAGVIGDVDVQSGSVEE